MSQWGTNSGIYLGYAADATEGQPSRPSEPLRYVGDRHIVTLGPNGSGKSRRSLLPNLVDLTGWSMLVVDPKGDLCAMTAAHRQRAGNQIIVLNPFNSLGLRSSGFNPIGALEMGEDFPDDALGLAESVIRLEGKEPHWSQSAQEWVTALIMYVRLMIPNGSFEDVRALLALDDDGIRTLVGSNAFQYKGNSYLGMVQAGITHDWEEIGVKASRFGDINPDNRELHSVISTALTQTRWLDSRPVKADLKGPAFDFAVMKERPVTVYLILPARRLATHSTWLRLMIAAVVQSLMKDTRRAKVPMLLMLDEFAQLGHLPIIENNLALMRGYGLKLWAVLQDLSQAKAIYGERWESFFGNAGVVQSFAAQDLVTAEYLSQRTGQTTRQVLTRGQSRSPNPGSPMGVSVSESANLGVIPMPLMLPQDIRNMDDGFSIIFSHKTKGTVRSHLPYPTELRHLREVCALDPAA